MGLELAFLILGLAGLILFGLGIRRIWQWQLARGSIQGLIGAVLLSLALLLASLAANLHTYQRLSHEAPVASLRFEQLGPQHFRAYLARPGQRAEIHDLYGDEWQLDARVLKWRGGATLLGLDSGYQLERLAGRYRDLQQEQSARRSVYTLYQGKGIDIWALARRHPDWLPWVDAVYGSATYLPMAHGARFAIRMSQSGLIARPLNDAAKVAVESWR
jgi:4-amino-4-deoxy-L-arabinose transferase-like glycosyltransferase